MSKDEVKTGPVKHFKSSFMGLRTSWKDRFLVLRRNSTLVWYDDNRRLKERGSIVVEPTCDYMAYGEATLSVGGRPGQPRGYSYQELFSVTRLPDWNSQREWFLFSSEGDVRSWLEAIVSTLSHVPASLVQQNSPYGAPPPQPMNYGQPAGFGQDTNAGTGMIMGAAALGMGAGMMGVPFINPGMSDIGGTMGGMDLF